MAGATLREQAYERLRSLILNGELKAGSFLTERSLVDRLGMSRTPIRAALEKLAADGLVDYTPNKGLVVTELSLRKAMDVYDFRLAMEAHVVRKLAGYAWSAEEYGWFEANLDAQKAAVGASDFYAFTQADYAFHLRLAQIYGNGEIVQALENVQSKLFLAALNVLRKEQSRIHVSYEDHVRLFGHIRDRQPDLAAETLANHLEFGKRILMT